MTNQEIIAALPYKEPFLFVDGITTISDKHIEGYYFFDDNAGYYQGHFIDNPITPGVLITECMAQIGLVCLGIYLINDVEKLKELQLGMTHNTIEFLKPVLPNTKLVVVSEVVYFRFNKLKCKVKALFEDQTIAAQGEIAGILKTQ